MEYKIKSRIWIENEQGTVLGEGRWQLLKEIKETGSLNKAANSLNMSYNKAWKLLNELNARAKEPVTINQTGGIGGGGALLTPYGEKMIVAFEEINEKCWRFLDAEFSKLEI